MMKQFWNRSVAADLEQKIQFHVTCDRCCKSRFHPKLKMLQNYNFYHSETSFQWFNLSNKYNLCFSTAFCVSCVSGKPSFRNLPPPQKSFMTLTTYLGTGSRTCLSSILTNINLLGADRCSIERLYEKYRK